jgi:hypothetical protein
MASHGHRKIYSGSVVPSRSNTLFGTRNNIMGRFLLGVTLVCAAWIILGVTEFNESYVFADPGIVDPRAANLAQWSGVATQQQVALPAFLSPFKYGLTTFLVFMFPPLCMPVWRDAEHLHKAINAVLLLLLAIDVFNLMQFNGYNSANGGYDGAGELVCFGLHGFFGAACVMLFLTRLAWRALNRDPDPE